MFGFYKKKYCLLFLLNVSGSDLNAGFNFETKIRLDPTTFYK